MTRSEDLPSPGALEEVRRLAGPSAVVRVPCGSRAASMRTPGGSIPRIPRSASSSASFRWTTLRPCASSGCCGPLEGLGGLAPVLLGGDLDGRWSEHPTSLVSWLDGQADITPADPRTWARELGRALAAVHAVPAERLAELPSVFDGSGGSEEILAGPLAAEVRSRWSEVVGVAGGAHPLRLLVGQRRLARTES